MNPEWIDVDTAIAVHDMQIRRHGGMPGIRDRDALEACLAQPWSGFGEVEFYPSVEEKAARLAYEVITGRKDKKLEDAKEELDRLFGLNVLPVAADVSAGSDNETAVQKVVKKAVDTFGRMDVLI